MAGLKLSLDQVAGLADALANNATFIASVASALTATNANVATVANSLSSTNATVSTVANSVSDVSASLASTNANVATVANTVTYVSKGYETVSNVAIQANGAVFIDLSLPATAYEIRFDRNITAGITYVNPPPAGTLKRWALMFKGVGQANSVSNWGSAIVHNGGNVPTINTANGKVTHISQYTDQTNPATVRSFKSGET